MHPARFDRLVQSLAATGSRRRLLHRLTALPLLAPLIARLTPQFGAESATAQQHRKLQHCRGERRPQVKDARKKKRKKKCAKTGQMPKKGKRCCKGLNKDGTGRCAASCAPATCAPNACGSVPDGCGGTLSCSCVGNTLCVGGACKPCDVCLSGCPFSAVQPAIDAAAPGATIRVCAGLYSGDVVIDKSLSLIGAGAGAGAGNSILQGSGTSSVLAILTGNAVSLQDLRITGGKQSSGGGIRISNSAALSLTACTITGNSAKDLGGGIANFGTLTLTGSTISGNTTSGLGGGIYNSLNDTVTLDAASRVTGNAADPNNPDSGGGIYNFGGTVTLSSADNVSGNTPHNCGGTAIPLCVD